MPRAIKRIVKNIKQGIANMIKDTNSVKFYDSVS